MVTSAIAWIAAKFLWAKDGAGRWFNAATGKAVAALVIAIAVLSLLALVYGAGSSGASARRDLSWIKAYARFNADRAKRHAAREEAARFAVEFQRDIAQTALRQALDKQVDLERELATLKSNPKIYTREERRRFFSR